MNKINLKKTRTGLDTVTHTFNPNTQEAEASISLSLRSDCLYTEF